MIEKPKSTPTPLPSAEPPHRCACVPCPTCHAVEYQEAGGIEQPESDPARILKPEGSQACGSAEELSSLRTALTAETQARQQAERERNEYRTLASVGRWHAGCRPNRQKAAQEIEKSQAVINKMADALTASERARATLQTALAGLVACCTTADGAIGPEPGDRGVWLRCMLEARDALSSSSDPRVTKTDDQGSR